MRLIIVFYLEFRVPVRMRYFTYDSYGGRVDAYRDRLYTITSNNPESMPFYRVDFGSPHAIQTILVHITYPHCKDDGLTFNDIRWRRSKDRAFQEHSKFDSTQVIIFFRFFKIFQTSYH